MEETYPSINGRWLMGNLSRWVTRLVPGTVDSNAASECHLCYPSSLAGARQAEVRRAPLASRQGLYRKSPKNSVFFYIFELSHRGKVSSVDSSWGLCASRLSWKSEKQKRCVQFCPYLFPFERPLPFNHSGNRKVFLQKHTCFHFIICTRHVRVPDSVKFRSILFNFPVPERLGYAYLSGSWKMKMAKPNVEGTPIVGSISKKWGLYRDVSVAPIHQLPVPGGKLWIGTTEIFLVYQSIIFELVVSLQPWCNPLFETRGAIHCFLQHMLVRLIVFYGTSNSIKTRLIKWKQ